MGRKRCVDHEMECYMPMNMNLNLLPLGSYDVMVGMDKLAGHRSKVDLFNKLVECFCDTGETIILQGKRNPMTIRQITM